jgi:hypothetical protein
MFGSIIICLPFCSPIIINSRINTITLMEKGSKAFEFGDSINNIVGPGPGCYYHPSCLVKSCSNHDPKDNTNAKCKSRHDIVAELQARASIRLRSNYAEKKKVKTQMLYILAMCKDISSSTKKTTDEQQPGGT